MPAWAVRIGFQVVKDPDKAIKWLFIGMMILLGLLMLLVMPFIFLFIPAAEPPQTNAYLDAARRIQTETGQQVSWQEMMALDAVLLKQDFSKSEERAYPFHREQFVWQEEVEVDCPGPPNNEGIPTIDKCKKTVYHSRSLEEVMTNLGLSYEDKASVQNYLLVKLDEDPNLELGPQTDTQPGNFTPVIHSFTWPCDFYYITSGFGGRIDPVTHIPGEIHGGIDIGAPLGSTVRATMKGVVTFSQFTESGGNIVTIDHQNGYVTRYLHLSRLLVNVGDVVEQNAVIALSGNTGAKTTGAHLHYEIHKDGNRVDPILFYQ